MKHPGGCRHIEKSRKNPLTIGKKSDILDRRSERRGVYLRGSGREYFKRSEKKVEKTEKTFEKVLDKRETL